MARIHGKNGTVKIESVGLLGITGWSVDYKSAADDQTGLDSAGVKGFLAGLTEWSGSFTAVWDTDEGDIFGAPPVLVVGTTVEVLLEMEAGGVSYEGDAIITGFKPDVAIDSVVKLNADFQGTGVLT